MITYTCNYSFIIILLYKHVIIICKKCLYNYNNIYTTIRIRIYVIILIYVFLNGLGYANNLY